MFDGFELTTIKTAETSIQARRGGEGPPVLLLHGHPQTHVMWHLVAPRLARYFTVVATDLRGYGDSEKPDTTQDHEPYSKRAMARDQIEVMRQLGFDTFSVAGHDRGGRVAYRMALDHPAQIEKLAVLDIVPTGEHLRRTDRVFAHRYWHWFFLSQPAPLPERLIGSDPDAFYLRDDALFESEALTAYRRSFSDPATIHAMCEDYRAGMTYDFALDEADRGTRQIICPTLALWAGRGGLGELYDVVEVWNTWAEDVSGWPLDGGHFLAEERPEETSQALLDFFGDG